MFLLLRKNHSAEQPINRFAKSSIWSRDEEIQRCINCSSAVGSATVLERVWRNKPYSKLCDSTNPHIFQPSNSNVTNNYQSRGSDTERRGRCLVLMQASGGSLLAKELHSQPVTVTNLAWHQADIQYPSTLSADWLEVIDLEQWGHLLNALEPPFCTCIEKLGQDPWAIEAIKCIFSKIQLHFVELKDLTLLSLVFTLHFVVWGNRCLIFFQFLEHAWFARKTTTKPHDVSVDWAWTTTSVWPAIDPCSSIFASLWAHMPSLCLSCTEGDQALCPGGTRGSGVCVCVWRRGVTEHTAS